MNLVFCGTPQFAVPTLEKLAQSGFNLRLVLTQPDRPQGRGLELVASPVKQAAQRFSIPVDQPDRIKNNEELRAKLHSLALDAIVIVAYGRIIPWWMLQLPKQGNLNVHASLLPKYRGAAPIQWAIANGDRVTGVTTMRIDQGLDTGDVLLQQAVAILDDETSETLAPRLAAIGADLMMETLRGLQSGSIAPRQQDDSRATLAPLLKKADGNINFQRAASEIYNRFRAFQPWPGAFTTFRGKNLNLTAMKPAAERIAAGELLTQSSRLLVGCGAGTSLEIYQLQPEGKQRMSPSDFIHGYRPQAGERLGS
jgi:methionyl-tRNA formyltransferase